MARVRFEPGGRIGTFDPGLTLLEAAESIGVEIDTCCRGGMCGTDPVRVLSGGGGLAPAEPHERGTIERMGLGPEYRLSCSAVIRSGEIVVEVMEF